MRLTETQLRKVIQRLIIESDKSWWEKAKEYFFPTEEQRQAKYAEREAQAKKEEAERRAKNAQFWAAWEKAKKAEGPSRASEADSLENDLKNILFTDIATNAGRKEELEKLKKAGYDLGDERGIEGKLWDFFVAPPSEVKARQDKRSEKIRAAQADYNAKRKR